MRNSLEFLKSHVIKETPLKTLLELEK